MLELKLKKKKRKREKKKKKKNRIEPRLSRTMKFDNVLSVWILLPLLFSSLRDLKKRKKEKEEKIG